MKHLAIIPARSGSKGLPDKNIKDLNGKPLIAYTIEAAIQSKIFDEVHVSTDSVKYAEISRNFGANVPFLRPADISTDKASTWDAVRYVLKAYEENGSVFDTLTVLQPTSPLRCSSDIEGAYDLFKINNADSVISVCEVDHSPSLMNVLPENFSLDGFITPETSLKRRQDINIYYRINGAIYIVSVKHILNGESLYGANSFAYVMEKRNSIDIDDAFDFEIAKCILSIKEKDALNIK